MGKPNGLLVPLGFTPCGASTCGLSTRLSPGSLQGDLILGWASPLDAFRAYPVAGWLPPAAPGMGQPVHQCLPRPGPLVLGAHPLKSPAPAADRDRTVSRRSEPSSRPPLMGEQPNPWDLLQPQDGGSRHRGTKPPRRCGLSGAISLLSPE